MINIFNQNYDYICMICNEEYDNSLCYTLPECNHKYHVNCIISWFRNGDSKCPDCRNKGINHTNTNNNNFYGLLYYDDRSSYTNTNNANEYVSDMKKNNNDKGFPLI